MIPAYNAEKYIREAVESAINQTYQDIEVIVRNDASTDKTLPIIKSYGDRISWMSWNINQGPAYTLNSAIKMARGEFIHWLSADDVLEPDAVEKMLKHIMTYKRKVRENSIFYSHYNVIDQNGKHLRTFKEPVRMESDLWKLFYGNGSSTMIHRNVFERCGLFDENLRHSEDYEFWLRASMVHGIRLRLVPEYTLRYRNHPDQLTNKVGGSLDEKIKASVRARLTTLKH